MSNLGNVVKELQHRRDQIDQAIELLTSLDGNVGRPAQRRRTLSAAARARISAAAKNRWSKIKAANKSSEPSRQKRHISAEGLARIRAAAKARWAKVRAQKKK